MASPWSTKGEKSPPLVSADEFMILDSEDATLSTKNKRVTLTTVQSNLVTSVDANDFNITKLNSISINDSANDNTFTISSSANLAADRTVNLPLLTADDTFAMLNVNNLFTQDQRISMFDSPTLFSFSSSNSEPGFVGNRLDFFYRRSGNLPLQTNDIIGSFLFTGRTGPTTSGFAALINGVANENWSATNNAGRIDFLVTPALSTSAMTQLTITGDEINFQLNDITNIKSIELRDSDQSNNYIILGGDLSNDFNVTIPTITANDTFALLGVNNTFTGANTWTDDLVQLEDNTSQNANFKGEIYSTSTVQQTSFQGFRAAGTKAIPAATTSGSVFVDLEAVGFNGTIFSVGGSVGFIAPATWSATSTPTTFSIFTTDINSITNVENLVIGADGTADFKGNNITNAIIQSTLTDGSILIGNESNVSKDFPTGLEVKADCVAATTEPGTLATSFEDGDIIDTVTLATADRILIKDQTDRSENGIYTVNNTGAPTRADDANEDSEVNNGMFTKITSGSANIDTAFVLVTPDTITLGTTDLFFNKFSFPDMPNINERNIFTELNSFHAQVEFTIDNTDDLNTVLEMFNNVPSFGTAALFQRARGTRNTPLVVLNNDIIAEEFYTGFNGTSFSDCLNIKVTATGDFTGVNHPVNIQFSTSVTGGLINRFNIAADGKSSFEGNTITKVGAIELDDSDASHSYTILGGDLSNDFNVTIPTIDANDTFALLNVQNDFTKRQIITIPLSSVVDGLSVGNADGQLVLGNNTADVGEFAPLLSLTSKGSDNPSTIQSLIAVVDDTGTTPLSVVNVLRVGGAAIATRPLWEIQNNGVKQVSVAADGDWDFQGNNITNAVIQSNLTNGSILIGDESNVSEDFPAKLQTKIDCRVATTANIDLSVVADPSPVDGVTLADNDRILLKNQTTALQNGIYLTVTAVDPTSWVRTTDANEDSEVNNGMFTKITEGTLNGNTAFELITPDPITVDVTDLEFGVFRLTNIAHLNGTQTFTNNNTYTGLNTFTTSLKFERDGSSALIDAISFSNIALLGAGLIAFRFRGTAAASLPLLNNDLISTWEALGSTGATFLTNEAGNCKFIATQNWSPTASGTKFQLSNTADGGTTPTLNLEIDQDGTADFQGNNISIGGFRASKRQIFLYHSSNDTLDSILLGAGSLSTTGTSTAVLDADGYYVNYLEGGMGADPDIICTDVTRRSHNFDLTFKIRSPASVDRRLWFGFFTADPSGSNTPVAQHIGLRVSTDATNTEFVLSHADGTTQAETILVAADTAIHTLRIIANDSNTEFLYSFDGGALVSVSTNIPASATNLDFYSIGTTLGAVPSQFDFWFLNGFADV